MTNLIASHGGYKNLKSFQMAEIIYDLTVEFCKLYIDRMNRTNETDRTDKTNRTYNSNRQAEQMLQAARSGKQNIGEGSQTSGTSKKSELRLVDVARASLQELLEDYEDFLRVNNLPRWSKDDPRAIEIRKLAYRTDRTDKTYRTYMTNPETAANCLLCLINQANFLLDQQLKSLEKDFKNQGDFPERHKKFRKEQIFGNNTDYDQLLKQHGLKRLENGQVVKLDK